MHVKIIGSTQINVVAMRPQQQNQRFITQQLSVQQPHYTMLTNQSITNNQDEHLEFANSIATHLARLNDDEVDACFLFLLFC